jgi:hypothetical protein
VISDAHCVFCWAAAGSLAENLAHMRAVHSFSIPDADACADPSGLVEHCHARVIEDRRCLFCESTKQFECPEAAQQHMADKAHARLRYDEEAHFEALEAFYDYSLVEGSEGEGEEGEGGDLLVNAAGELRLPGGRVAIPRDMVRYYKQRTSLADERASVRTTLGMGLLEGARGSDGAPRGGAPSLAAAAKALGHGTRGNAVDRREQRREVDYHSYKLNLVARNMNDIRRLRFRVAEAKGRS